MAIEASILASGATQTFSNAFVTSDDTDWNASNDSAELAAEVASTVSNEDVLHPTSFALHANYPNPFTRVTTVSYDVKFPTHVHLSIYNMLGQRVSTLVDGIKEAGRHEVLFEAQDLAAGTYIIRIDTAEFTKSTTVSLLK